MSNYIVIQPYSRKFKEMKIHPKEYPYWEELLKMIKEKYKYTIFQLGVKDEVKINGVDIMLPDLKMEDIVKIVDNALFFICIDSFLHHLANCHEIKTKGFVIWGLSDPEKFGYPQFTNILKDREYLRKNPYLWWKDEEVNTDAFYEADVVFDIISKEI